MKRLADRLFCSLNKNVGRNIMPVINPRTIAALFLSIAAVVTLHGQAAVADEGGAATTSLEERRGSGEGIQQILVLGRYPSRNIIYLANFHLNPLWFYLNAFGAFS